MRVSFSSVRGVRLSMRHRRAVTFDPVTPDGAGDTIEPVGGGIISVIV